MPGSRPPIEELSCTGIGIFMVGLSNYWNRKPLLSRIYIYPLAAVVGFGIGRAISDVNGQRIANRELAIWDYVHRHPEDFPELTPKKYKEILEPWQPIR